MVLLSGKIDFWQAGLPVRPSQNEFRKRVRVRHHLISARQDAQAAFGNAERDRPGCRFRRRAENPSTN